MIRRRSDNSYILIPQEQHARVAADVALQLGGAVKPSSRPTDLAGALRIHSAGFVAIDAQPPLCAAGRPANFDELPLSTSLDAWTQSAESALAAGPYPALLISILCLQRTIAIANSAKTIRENFYVNKVQHRQLEIQEQLRPQLNLRNDLPLNFGLPEPSAELTQAESLFYHDYRLMLLCISLALQICAHKGVVGHLAPTPPAPGQPAIPIAYRMLNSTHCTLDPFPLAGPTSLHLTGRQVSAQIYDHPSELAEALAQAESVNLEVVCTPRS